MINDYTLGMLKARLDLRLANLPADVRPKRPLITYGWFQVAASTSAVAIELHKVAATVDAQGKQQPTGEQLAVAVELKHKVPLPGMDYCSLIRLGWDDDAEIVIWSLE